MNSSTITQALSWRYAVKTFDPTKTITEEQLTTILEAGRLSPSSYGVEPWKFLHITNTELRKKLREAGYGQSKITDAPHLIVIASRTDATAVADELVARTAKAQGKNIEDMKGFSDMVHGAVASKGDNASTWLKSQTYIALGVMLETAALLGVDAGPMEGFDPSKVDEILGLKEKNLQSVTMLALGHRGDDMFAKLPKVRKSFDEAVETIA